MVSPKRISLIVEDFIFQDQEWRDTEIDDSDESQEELDEKGEEKVMIPVEKLTIPEELCKMKSTGRGRGTKKFLVF